MAKNDKPVKIKRYKNSMGGKSSQLLAVKRVLSLLAGAVLVVVLGFFLAKPVLGFISGIASKEPPVQDQPTPPVTDTQPQITDQPQVTPQPTTPPQSDVVVNPQTKKVYYYVNAANLTTVQGIDKAIADMQAKGATHLVFDAKNADGYLNYNSENQYGSQLKSDVQIDIKTLSSKLKSKGLTPVARIYTFMDKMISTVERSTAVMYLGTDTRWLDTSAALGGKAWANPASKIMQDYIIAITDEVLALGATDILYAGFCTPTGYSLDKRDFGATSQQVLANMKNLIGTLQAKVSAKGGSGLWQFEYSAVTADGSYAHYIVHPYQLGAEDIILTAKGEDIDQSAVDMVKASLDTEDINSISLWLVDNVNTELTKVLDDYFVY